MEYRKILLTHDSSVLADAAIGETARLARVTGASVLVLHAIESVGDAAARMAAGENWEANEASVHLAGEAIAAQRGEAQRTLDRVEAVLREAGVSELRTLVVEGEAGAAIVDAARREECDVVAIATHGRSGVVRSIVGSVTEYVVRNAGSAVLVCRCQPT